MHSEMFKDVYTKKGAIAPFFDIFQLETEMRFQIIENMPKAIFWFESLFQGSLHFFHFVTL